MGTTTDPTKNSSDDNSDSYLLKHTNRVVAPQHKGDNPAADVIRDKLERLYASEPDAFAEIKQAPVKNRSKHQEFMHQLNNSGKSLAQVQTEWHNYYVGLPDDQKHQVWQEFYASNDNDQGSKPKQPVDNSQAIAGVRSEIPTFTAKLKRGRADRRAVSNVQEDIRKHATKRKITKRQHLQSLGFGLGIGAVFVFVFLFSFFNEVIIAPFIQPARVSADTPLIINSETVAPTDEAQVIIPKINVQIPIRFDASSTSEETMQKELESGIAHYPTTVMPGEVGNGAYFGHSSNNIFNKGQYKFAFVLLNQLVVGDTFYITKDRKIYAYKVFDTKIVEPYQTEVLDPVDGHSATATLITCDPPGTSLRRLVVVGDQISPDPVNNTIANIEPLDSENAVALVGNGQTLWGRVISTNAGKTVVALLIVGSVIVIFRTTSKPKRP